GALEPESLRFLEPSGDPLHATQLTAEAELSNEHRAWIGRAIAQRRRHGHRQTEVRGGLTDPETADEIHVDVVIAGREPGTLGEHREKQEHALRIGAVHRAPWQPEARRRHERLYLDEERPRPFDRRHDDAPGNTAAALFEEDFRWIRDLAKAVLGHLEDADLVSRAK